MKEFLTQYRKSTKLVDVGFEREILQRIVNNQKLLESLFRIVLLCGKQRIPLWGHKDDNISWFEEDDDNNEENFIELVRFRAATDDILSRHLKSTPKNAHYTSKTIQNEIIDVIGTHWDSQQHFKWSQKDKVLLSYCWWNN